MVKPIARQQLQTIRLLRGGSLALLLILMASLGIWMAQPARDDLSIAWPLISATASIALLVIQIFACTSDCPVCGQTFLMARKEDFLSWRGFIGPARCVHCGIDENALRSMSQQDAELD